MRCGTLMEPPLAVNEVFHLTLKEAFDFIDSYSVPYKHYDLSRVITLLDLLGDPHKKLRFVHVTGTNGKGSTCAMLASILQKAGYRTGLFTSPHILRYNERMQINGEQIPDDDLVRITETVKNAIDRTEEKVNWFEMVMCTALCWFAEQKADIVMFEVGVGGKLDGTNVIDVPECAVITNIGLDHIGQLGDTVEKIAEVKSGIIKEHGSAVIYRGSPSVEKVIEDRCAEVSAELHKADFDSIRFISQDIFGQTFDACGYEALHIPLTGEHQRKNTCVVLEVVKVLRNKGWNISDDNVREGLEDTVWPVRMEVVSRDPVFIIDGGHNPQCAHAIVDSINELIPSGTRIVFMTGIMADKNYEEFMRIISSVSKEFVTVAADYHRALSADDLARFIDSLGLHATMCSTVEEGVKKAIELADGGVVCCVGSLYLAGEARAVFSSDTSLRRLV